MKKEERQVLFRKYIKNGFSYEEAKFKINSLEIQIKELKQKIRKKTKSEKSFNENFKQEFNKLIERELNSNPKRRFCKIIK